MHHGQGESQRGVFIDHDHTLGNCDGAMDAAIAYAFTSQELKEPDAEWIQKGVRAGQNMLVTFQDVLREHYPGIQSVDDKAYELYTGYEDGLIQPEAFARVEYYPGVQEGLLRLSAEGYRMVCVSNKSQRVIESWLFQAGLSDYFVGVVGAVVGLPNKPNREAWARIEALCDESGFRVDPAQCFMIGDTLADLQFAQNCEMAGHWHVTYGKGKDSVFGDLMLGAFDSFMDVVEAICGGGAQTA